MPNPLSHRGHVESLGCNNRIYADIYRMKESIVINIPDTGESHEHGIIVQNLAHKFINGLSKGLNVKGLSSRALSMTDLILQKTSS